MGGLRRLGGIHLLAVAELISALVSAFPARAQETGLAGLSLKSLMDLDVTSVSKRSQKLGDVATSIYVITEEDIRRSGATRLQDILKMAPGTWFSDASYSISGHSVRGGALVFKPTLLWILDGVPIANPTTGGLMFSVLDLPLADIERIELIKGPGGTIYGANAATGIISIVTRQGEASIGLQAALDGGTRGYLAPFIRYGLEPRENIFLAAWIKGKTHDGYARTPLFSGDSLWAPLQGGGRVKVRNQFRAENDDGQNGLSGGLKWDLQASETWRLTGGISRSRVSSPQYGIIRTPYPESPPATPQADPKPPDSLFLSRDRQDRIIAQSRIDFTLGEEHNLFLNAYRWQEDFQIMSDKGIFQTVSVTELELQDNWRILGAHRLSAGTNLRRFAYHYKDPDGSRSSVFATPKGSDYLAGVFLQDEITLGSRWRVTLGSKAEVSSLTDYTPEVAPSLRLAFLASPEMTLWMAASRSITTPSYIQSDIELRITQIPPFWVLKGYGFTEAPPAAGKWVSLVPGSDVEPTEYRTLEVGKRGSHGSRIQWDVSAFYSWVGGVMGLTLLDSTLRSLVPSQVTPGDSLVPMYYGNLIDMGNFGGEALLRLQPADFLRLEFSYSTYVVHNRRGRPIPRDPMGRSYSTKGSNPQEPPVHAGRVKAYMALPGQVDLSLFGIASSPFTRGAAFNYVTQRVDVNGGGVIVDPPRPQYQLDLSLQKSLYRGRVTCTLWGRNLLADPFVEMYNAVAYTNYPRQVHRTFGAGISYRY